MCEAGKTRCVNREFLEQIKTAVTEMNDCRYWPYFHTHVALYAGFIGELELMLLVDYKNAPQEEVAALYFAQYYAETGGKEKLVAVQRMHEIYGEAMT